MQNQIQPSPMLRAIDLMRVNITQLDLYWLQSHAADVKDTIAELNTHLNSRVRRSREETNNIISLSDRLCFYMAYLRDVMNARMVSETMTQQLQSTAPLDPAHAAPAMGRRVRVIRQPVGADMNSRPTHDHHDLSQSGVWDFSQHACTDTQQRGRARRCRISQNPSRPSSPQSVDQGLGSDNPRSTA